MNNPVVLVLPDIHGRDFYRSALREAVEENIEVVCLGDYLDPYFGDVLHENWVFVPLDSGCVRITVLIWRHRAEQM